MEQKRFPVFSERFAELRGRKTQGEFAEFLGISRPTVGFYENGTRLPDALILRQISEKCNVSTDWLLGLSKVKDRDGDLQQACAYTGLSDIAISEIRTLYATEKNLGNEDFFTMAELLSAFVVCPCFTPMIEDLQAYFSAFYHVVRWDGEYGAGFSEPEAEKLIEQLRAKCGKNVHILYQNEVPNYYRNNVQTYFSMLIDEIAETIKEETKREYPLD